MDAIKDSLNLRHCFQLLAKALKEKVIGLDAP